MNTVSELSGERRTASVDASTIVAYSWSVIPNRRPYVSLECKQGGPVHIEFRARKRRRLRIMHGMLMNELVKRISCAGHSHATYRRHMDVNRSSQFIGGTPQDRCAVHGAQAKHEVIARLESRHLRRA